MPTIFDLVQAPELAAYWNVLSQDEAPYPGQELFPVNKKMGLNLKWIKGAQGLPVVLKPANFDTAAIPRARIGFDKLTADMPYFKESTYIDEELRQELNLVMETGNQAYIEAVLTRVFDDEMRLLRGAAAQREAMRMMALTTGYVTLSTNGQYYNYDYDVTHKGNASISWSDLENADPMEDIREAKQKILDDTGVVVTRAMCDSIVWRQLRNCDKIKKSVYPLTGGIGTMTDDMLHDYIMRTEGISVYVNDKRYIDEAGNQTKYMPENTFVLFPSGQLGNTWFGTTPAESDLMASQVGNVSIVDTGVSVNTIQKADPVNVETVVAMICLPSFEQADKVYIMDTVA